MLLWFCKLEDIRAKTKSLSCRAQSLAQTGTEGKGDMQNRERQARYPCRCHWHRSGIMCQDEILNKLLKWEAVVCPYLLPDYTRKYFFAFTRQHFRGRVAICSKCHFRYVVLIIYLKWNLRNITTVPAELFCAFVFKLVPGPTESRDTSVLRVSAPPSPICLAHSAQDKTLNPFPSFSFFILHPAWSHVAVGQKHRDGS